MVHAGPQDFAEGNFFGGPQRPCQCGSRRWQDGLVIWPRRRSNGPQWRGLGQLSARKRRCAPDGFFETAVGRLTRPWSQLGALLRWDPLGPQTMSVSETCDAAAAHGEFVDETSSEAGHSTSSTYVLICQRRSDALLTLQWPAGGVKHWSAVQRLLPSL